MIVQGDCVALMAELAPASVDAIVTDPPYGLEFMGKEWDRLTWDRRGIQPGDPENKGQTASPHRGADAPTFIGGARAQVWHEAWAREALRVLKPGGHLLACAIEDAGFEIRDCLAWLYGSGFPKSLDVSKAIDKAAGAEREVIGRVHRDAHLQNRYSDPESQSSFLGATGHFNDVTIPATPEAQQWQGWGTALKPSHEPIVLARKPLAGTVAANVQAFSTGALNIDGTRIGTDMGDDQGRGRVGGFRESPVYGNGTPGHLKAGLGRWPANVLLDEEAAGMLDEQSGSLTSGSGEPFNRNTDKHRNAYGAFEGRRAEAGYYGDTGGASRFFYVAKSSSAERSAGLGGVQEGADRNSHPT